MCAVKAVSASWAMGVSGEDGGREVPPKGASWNADKLEGKGRRCLFPLPDGCVPRD